MHVLQFFNALLLGKKIEVIISLLPERTTGLWLRKQFVLSEISWFAGLPRTVLLQELDGGCQRATRSGSETRKVNMLRHDDVTHHHAAATLARALQRSKKEVTLTNSAEQRHPAIATEGDEMKLAGVLISL